MDHKEVIEVVVWLYLA